MQEVPLNRPEVIQFLETFFKDLENSGIGRPAAGAKTSSHSEGRTMFPLPAGKTKSFLDLVLSLKKELPLSIPLLRELAGILTDREAVNADKSSGILHRRINRRYLRLCRMQEELGRLNLKKAPPGVSPEDYIFSQIDFSRYREMSEADFSVLFPEGLADFDDDFLKDNFGLGRPEIQITIEDSYKKSDGFYKLKRESPLVLSIMRTLETSMENLPLFTAREINHELKNLWNFISNGTKIPRAQMLFPLLVYSLDNTAFPHEDGMITKLFISPEGGLSGTFRPGNKPWTCELIPGKLLAQ